MDQFSVSAEYGSFLADIKQRYQKAQIKAAHAVNVEMIGFYWQLGHKIIEIQAENVWGSKFLEKLSKDLQREFSGSAGFSVRNLKYMRKFATVYPVIGQQPVAQLPWGHIIVLLEKIKDHNVRDWYADSILKNGTSRSALITQIKQNLYERQGKNAHKITNFAERLPSPQSDLATQLFKDPYDFRFLPVTEMAQEREIEKSMVSDLRKLFLELGTGFAYMGNQYKLSLGDNDYFLDMLFYNVELRSFFIVELKNTEIKPEHVGKLNFYLAIVDDFLRKSDDNPSIGLLLCRKQNRLVAEYALKKTDGAIGIAEYLLSQELPSELQENLPAIEAIESILREEIDEG